MFQSLCQGGQNETTQTPCNGFAKNLIFLPDSAGPKLKARKPSRSVISFALSGKDYHHRNLKP